MSSIRNEKKSDYARKPFWSRLLGEIFFSDESLRKAKKGSDSGKSAESRHDVSFQKTPFQTESTSRFELGIHGLEADHYFARLRRLIFRHLDRSRPRNRYGVLEQPSMFREFGELDGQRDYFYLKPHGEPGWLFERAGQGWIISRCEKIMGQKTFVRRTGAYDVVSLYSPVDGEGPPRVRSHRTDGDVISLMVYEGLVLKYLGIDFDI